MTGYATTLPDRLRLAAADIKLAHTVFALPFAILGACLAFQSSRLAGSTRNLVILLLLTVVCMFFARTWAMLVNRLADRRLDAANARTAGRPLPSGRLRARDALLLAIGCAAAFQLVTAGFWILFDNPWPTWLALPVLAWIAFYSFTKRFTAMCHLFLGGALAASPIAAAIAVDPASLGTTPALWLIAAMVLFWVAGFDVIYALQDIDHDRRIGLHSIPASLGPLRAARVSRAFHIIAAACLAGAWLVDDRLGVLFGASLILVVVLLITEHIVLTRHGLKGLNLAFFTLNGVVSCVLGLAGSIDAFV